MSSSSHHGSETVKSHHSREADGLKIHQTVRHYSIDESLVKDSEDRKWFEFFILEKIYYFI